MSLPHRSAVAEAETWDLTPLYANDQAFAADLRRLAELVQDFAHIYTGRLTQPAVIADCLDDYANILTIMDHLDHYGFLPQSADTTDASAADRANRTATALAQANGQLTFVEAELQAQPADTLASVAAIDADHAAFIRHIQQAQQDALPPATEKALAELAPALDAPNDIRSQTVFADMDFGTFTANGRDYPLSFVLYEEDYQKHPDVAVRRAAYAKFSAVLAQYQNTMAAGYYAQVAKEKTLATMRGYDSVIDYLLRDQEIPRALFDRQIDVLMQDLAPVMRRYVHHLKEQLGLDRITYTDLQADLDPDFAPQVTWAQAPAYVKRALAPLGDDYARRIAQAFDQRWVDRAANVGKESGAFATAPYGLHPYVLMTWRDGLPALYTLIHELGHCGQMTLADEHHSILAHEPSLYIVEAPSTFHELLLTHSLLTQNDDPRLQRFALSRLLSDTYFHNCVTHLLEAAFQREVYTLIDRGESFDAAKLNAIKRKVLATFWGDAVDLDFGAPELTWMRQSHYYMGLYSYTYSASMVVATGAYLRWQNGDVADLSDWRNFLALGDTQPPIEAARVAGVDIANTDALHAMVAFLDRTEKQMETLSQSGAPRA
ncbi:oligoendopeptidase F [Lacticaseibacillus baoqingensis]|uniref:Oligopeptidase F n=1 Tax=Lacticaseibacillus baoqingensis TaxID=2486013 RepID=A0ABW4E4H8_9LACO|nr:oligoendopeptidase F [Lacticaseibacillus baoqingensis]